MTKNCDAKIETCLEHSGKFRALLGFTSSWSLRRRLSIGTDWFDGRGLVWYDIAIMTEKSPFDFIISDTHFYHKKIVEYEPMRTAWGADSNTMSEHMISEWNRIVPPDATVLHLGDFCLGNADLLRHVCSTLNGRITLTHGNHDRNKSALLAAGITEVHTSLIFDVTVQGERWEIVCAHNPHHLREKYWPTDHPMRLYLHGHTHSLGYQKNILPATRGACASVESIGSACPVPFDKFLSNIVLNHHKS